MYDPSKAAPDGRLLLEQGFNGSRCYVDCPAAGYRREVASITYKDGGVLRFPFDFSERGDVERLREAQPHCPIENGAVAANKIAN